jgi:phospholipase/carboxylesterase
MTSKSTQKKRPPLNVEEHRLVVPHSAYYAVLKPDLERDAKPPILVVLHGYGQRASKFIEQFAPLRDAGVLVVAPQGPNAFYWQQNGGVGFAWLTRYEKQQALADLLGYMRLLFNDLGRVHAYDEGRVFLLGFSQGTALAYRTAAAGVAKLRGLVTCGADLPPDVAERLGDMERLPVLVVHGKNDDLIPIAKAEEAAATLDINGFHVTRHFFDGGHDLRPEEVERIAAWMNDVGGV